MHLLNLPRNVSLYFLNIYNTEDLEWIWFTDDVREKYSSRDRNTFRSPGDNPYIYI